MYKRQALNNGNSGGPLINAYGQVIGINTLKMSTTDDTEATVEGLGFALPISSVSFVVNDIIATGSYRGAPSLGITVTTVEKDGGGTQVQVVEVSGGSGAADAGIQAGDVILAADGQSISVTSDLLTVRRSHVIGDTVTLTTTASDGGTVAPAGQTTYVSGQAVDVTFTPDQGYQLASVKVNGRTASVTGNVLTLTMDQSYAVSAVFEKIPDVPLSLIHI